MFVRCAVIGGDIWYQIYWVSENLTVVGYAYSDKYVYGRIRNMVKIIMN